MATGMLPFRPVVVVRAAANRKPEPPRKGNWWSPLFGFSSEADYINPTDKRTPPERKPEKSGFEPGSFTEEKARQLRRMTTDASSFHDMYHSSIASRLASDFSDRN